jgi:glycosyltransferase involved in cell wall biosynthesis
MSAPHEPTIAVLQVSPVEYAGSRLRALLRRLRAGLTLLTPGNLAKGLARIRHGEFRLLLSIMRNLAAHQTGLAEANNPAAAERFTPLPDTPGTPLVTIVIPCFNDGRYVGEAVASALAQTFRDLEVIVVDGGSTDGVTPAIVAALAGPRVRTLLRTDGRHYVGDNRNFGIAACNSRFICCLDSDDVLEPTYIEKTLFQLEYRAYDVCSTSMRMFGAKEGTWRTPERPTLDDFLRGNQALACSVFRRRLWEVAGQFHDTGLGRDHVAEDWDLWVRIAAHGARFRNLSGEFLLNYRVRDSGGSISTHPDLPSWKKQGSSIGSRNKPLLTPQARRNSRRQAGRRLLPAEDGVAMRRALEADPRPTLLLGIPFFILGGAERLLAAVVGGLSAAGWRVVVVSTEFEPVSGGDALPWFTAHTAECYALPRFLPPDEWGEFLDYLIGSRRPDALLIAGSRFLYDLLPRLAAQYPAMARLDLLFNTEGHVAKHLEHRALLTGALCESTPVRDWLSREAHWSDSALRCIQSGVDTTFHSPAPRPAALVEQLGIAPDDIVIGWSGRLSEEKSPETFLKLATHCADLSRVHFVMTGGGPMEDRIAALQAQMPKGVRFHRFGLVDDIRDFYRLYDVYALTSRLDGRPLAVMEAQANGCAVLAARIGGVPEIMKDGVTGALATPADAADFARALRLLVADRAQLAAMQQAAVGLAQSEFSVDAMVDGYRDALYEAVTAVSCPPHRVNLPRIQGTRR